MSHNELLRLLSVLEGELQAKELVIAVMRCQQLNRQLNCGLNNAFCALERDSISEMALNDSNLIHFNASKTVETLKCVYRKQINELTSKFNALKSQYEYMNHEFEQQRQRQKFIVTYLMDERKLIINEMIQLNQNINQFKQQINQQQNKVNELSHALEEETKR